MNVKNKRQRFTVLLGLLIFQSDVFAEGDVTATFRIESNYFIELMPDQVISDVERSVANKLSIKAAELFPFLDWQAADQNPIIGPQLVLRMIDITGGACDSPPSINLELLGVIAGNRRPLNGVKQQSLYQTCDPDVPTQEPERLTLDIVNAVELMLSNDATQKKVLEQLLAKVPFARELINQDNAMLLLPVSGPDLAADNSSEMVAEFNFVRADSEPLFSRITMQPHNLDGDNVSVKILSIDVPSITANLQVGGGFWDDTLGEVLRLSSDMKVYMKKYVANPFAGQTVDDTDVLSEL